MKIGSTSGLQYTYVNIIPGVTKTVYVSSSSPYTASLNLMGMSPKSGK